MKQFFSPFSGMKIKILPATAEAFANELKKPHPVTWNASPPSFDFASLYPSSVMGASASVSEANEVRELREAEKCIKRVSNNVRAADVRNIVGEGVKPYSPSVGDMIDINSAIEKLENFKKQYAEEFERNRGGINSQKYGI